MKRGPNLTVEQLIGKLQKVEDKSKVIYIDGCDCGDLASHVYPFEDWIVIGRADQFAERRDDRGDL